MAIYTTVKCTYCNYERDYDQHTFSIYKYKDIPQIMEYPHTYTGWCTNCKDFTVIAKGINIQDIKEKKAAEIESIIKRCNKFINFSSDTHEIQSIIKRIEAFSKIEFAISGRNTIDYCTECGNTSIIKKNISKQLWSCPECRKGFLRLEKTSDDILYRKGVKEIALSNKKQFDFIYDLINCCDEVIFNETAYLWNTKKDDVLLGLRGCFEVEFIDRLSLIYSYLEIFFNLKLGNATLEIIEKKFLQKAMSGKINYNERLKQRTAYFRQEIEVELSCSNFMPTAIIKTLRTPNNPPTHSTIGINPIDATNHWKIIADTINACFYYLKQ